MQVIHKLKMDLLRQNNTQIIDAVQLDSNTRKLELSLYEGAMPWDVPEGVSVAVAYLGPGGKGIYDTLPDGSAACTVAGNVVTATVIPQALAMHGNVQLTVVFTDDSGKQLSTFCVTFRVAVNPAVGAVRPPDYINLRQWVAAEVAELMAEMQRTYIMLYANDDGSYSTRWQAADIQAAYQSGRELCCVVPVNGQQVMLPLLSAQEDGTRLICTFGGSAAWLSGDEACTVSAQLDVADEAVAVMVLVSQGGGSSGGTDYTLPVATPNRLGGVKPVEATEEMTQPVGVTLDGKLMTAPGGGSGGSLTTAQIAALDELFKIAAYTEDASAKYAAFCEAFGLDIPVEPEEPEAPDEPIADGYTKVAYLSSAQSDTPTSADLAKTPYIKYVFPNEDTDILNYEITCTFQQLFTDEEACVFGNAEDYMGVSNSRSCAVFPNASVFSVRYGNVSDTTPVVYSTNLVYDCTKKITVMLKDGKIYVDGAQVRDTEAISAVIHSKFKMALFRRNPNSSLSDTRRAMPFIGKIYEFSVKDASGEYVLNYVPVVRNADGVYGMYDTVTGVFHTSANAYNFTGGND